MRAGMSGRLKRTLQANTNKPPRQRARGGGVGVSPAWQARSWSSCRKRRLPCCSAHLACRREDRFHIFFCFCATLFPAFPLPLPFSQGEHGLGKAVVRWAVLCSSVRCAHTLRHLAAMHFCDPLLLSQHVLFEQHRACLRSMRCCLHAAPLPNACGCLERRRSSSSCTPCA